MANLQTIINQVLIIYVMILVGLYGSKIKILTPHVNYTLSKLLLNITLPLYIISSFNFEFSTGIFKNMLIVLFFGLLMHPLCYLLGLIIYNKNASKNIFIFALIFTNCGYMAFPILESIYGKIGVIYGSIFLAPFNIYLWTIGISLFNKENKAHKQAFINPGIIAVVIGLIIYLFSLKFPYFIEKSIDTIGSMTIPLSMLIIGGIISDIKLKELFKEKSIYFNSVLRLIIIPLIIYLIFMLFDIDKIVFGVCVLISAMPVAITSPIFAQRYNNDKELASKTVFISTLLSIITIPFFVFLVTY